MPASRGSSGPVRTPDDKWGQRAEAELQKIPKGKVRPTQTILYATANDGSGA